MTDTELFLQGVASRSMLKSNTRWLHKKRKTCWEVYRPGSKGGHGGMAYRLESAPRKHPARPIATRRSRRVHRWGNRRTTSTFKARVLRAERELK